MKPVREIISREIIDDLWGAGYTILPRARHPDPFFVPPEMVPQGRSYQWMHLVHDRFHIGHAKDHSDGGGWAPVPASRHDGYFMPAGFIGDIEVNGLGLFEKPKFEVDAEHAANEAKSKKMLTDWAEQNSALFTGDVRVGDERTEIGETKTIENTTKIPRELTPYIAQIFEERDRLNDEQLDAWKHSDREPTEMQRAITKEYNHTFTLTPEAPEWPTLNAIVLPYAIDNIRKRIAEEATNGQAS
jgi:hypothetical protein